MASSLPSNMSMSLSYATVTEIAKYVRNLKLNGFAFNDYADILERERINGKVFLALTLDGFNSIGIIDYPRRKLFYQHIKSLRSRNNIQINVNHHIKNIQMNMNKNPIFKPTMLLPSNSLNTNSSLSPTSIMSNTKNTDNTNNNVNNPLLSSTFSHPSIKIECPQIPATMQTLPLLFDLNKSTKSLLFPTSNKLHKLKSDGNNNNTNNYKLPLSAINANVDIAKNKGFFIPNMNEPPRKKRKLIQPKTENIDNLKPKKGVLDNNCSLKDVDDAKEKENVTTINPNNSAKSTASKRSKKSKNKNKIRYTYRRWTDQEEDCMRKIIGDSHESRIDWIGIQKNSMPYRTICGIKQHWDLMQRRDRKRRLKEQKQDNAKQSVNDQENDKSDKQEIESQNEENMRKAMYESDNSTDDEQQTETESQDTSKMPKLIPDTDDIQDTTK